MMHNALSRFLPLALFMQLVLCQQLVLPLQDQVLCCTQQSWRPAILLTLVVLGAALQCKIFRKPKLHLLKCMIRDKEAQKRSK